MTDLSAVLKYGVSAFRGKREPTKLECGLIGALLASMFMTFLFWLGIQLSLLTLIIHTT